MFKNLLRYSAETLIDIGSRTLAGMAGDDRLAEAKSILEPSQQALVAKVAVWKAAVDAARNAASVLRVSKSALVMNLRELGFACLTLTNNHHGRTPYMRYFPDGYGILSHVKPDVLVQFATTVLDKLMEETEPSLVALRERITAARDAHLGAWQDLQMKLDARKVAFELADAEKLVFIRALHDARHNAELSCYDQKSYVRDVFEPALPERRSGTAGTTSTDGSSAGGPDHQGDPAPAPAGVPANGGSSGTSSP